MALNLGGTVEELQGKIKEEEFGLWIRYRNKYGPLNPVRMYDRAGAIVASQVNKFSGGKANPIDFMAWPVKQEEPDATPEQFIAALGKGVKIGR